MYSIFHPLDATERLPRELILEGRRHRLFELRNLELAGALYLPALIVAIVVMSSIGFNVLLAFGLSGLILLAVLVYVLTARYR